MRLVPPPHTSHQSPRTSSAYLLAKLLFFRVASPKSPIFTEPVGPVMKMLSHLRSLWMTGGSRVWRNCNPWKWNEGRYINRITFCLEHLSIGPLRHLQYLAAPRFQDFRIDLFESSYVRLESPGRHQFRDHDKIFFPSRILVFPRVVKPDNVRML